MASATTHDWRTLGSTTFLTCVVSITSLHLAPSQLPAIDMPNLLATSHHDSACLLVDTSERPGNARPSPSARCILFTRASACTMFARQPAKAHNSSRIICHPARFTSGEPRVPVSQLLNLALNSHPLSWNILCIRKDPAQPSVSITCLKHVRC